MRRPNRKPATKEDFLAALDDYKREQDERQAWDKPPIIDLPKVPPMRRPRVKPE